MNFLSPPAPPKDRNADMGKHATLAQKVVFLVHLEYVSCAEAARKAGIPSSTTTDLRDRAGALCIERSEAGLPPPSYEEQVTRKPGSRALVKLTVDAVIQLLEACTLNKKQRKKLW